jgi:hypothetical protein
VWHQAHGRTDRLNTPFKVLDYYTLMSDAWIDKKVKECLDQKHSFNEVKLARGWGIRKGEPVNVG